MKHHEVRSKGGHPTVAMHDRALEVITETMSRHTSL